MSFVGGVRCAMISLASLGDVLGCDSRLTDALTRLGWNVARLATLKDDDDGEMTELLMLNVQDSVDDGCKVHVGELTELIEGAQSTAQTGWATEGRFGGSDLVEASCLARAKERLNGLRKATAVWIHAKIPARGKAPRTRWPTRIGKRLAQVEDDAVQREIVERDERERWIKELYKLLKAGAVPALAHLTPEAGAEVTRPHCKRSACWDLAHAREDMGKGSTVLAEHIPDLLAHRAHACCVLSRLSHVESP